MFNIFSLPLYGISVFLGSVIAYFLALKRGREKSFSKEKIDRLVFLLIPSSIIGARVYHVLSWYYYYRLFPKEIFFLWQGGLGIYGALIFGIASTYLVSRLQKINFLALADVVSPSFLIAQAVGRVGNLFNLEAFGPPTNLPWKIYIPPDKRPINFLEQPFFHPTFLYESLLCFFAFFLILKVEKKLKKGGSFGLYLLSYGFIRFFTEFLRFDTWRVDGLKIAHILSLIFILAGAYLIRKSFYGFQKR